MKNRGLISLLTVVAVLLAANLVVMATGSVWAQPRGQSVGEDVAAMQDRGRPQPPDRTREQRRDPDARPERPQRPAGAPSRAVGITAARDQIYVLYHDGTVERREVPE